MTIRYLRNPLSPSKRASQVSHCARRLIYYMDKGKTTGYHLDLTSLKILLQEHHVSTWTTTLHSYR